MQHPTTYFFKSAECKIYVGLIVHEAKLLAWDHNNDNDYRQKMSSIERIRFFHYEYLDALKLYGSKLNPGLRRHCLNEVGIVTDDTKKSKVLGNMSHGSNWLLGMERFGPSSHDLHDVGEQGG